ncbi:MAG: hypothetical protein IMZ58_04730 [Thermoplasmata archaeon]|nr:hypothetical protein [Thermoplasmata archaeon]
MINTPLKKSLVFGIILLLSLSIEPIVSGLSVEKHVLMTTLTRSYNTEIKTEQRGLNITFNGTMGQNGWYISPVEIIIVFENDSFISHFYYHIDNGDLIEYTPPVDNVFVNEDGVHYFAGYFTDYEGNIEGSIGPFTFKIDKTSSVITQFKPIRVGIFKWKFTANVYDATSGVNRIEFIIDQTLINNDTEPPYEAFWKGLMLIVILKFRRTGDFGYLPHIIAYDDAGNFLMSPTC